MEMSGKFHAPVALPSKRNADPHGIGGWVGPSAGLDVLEMKSFLPLPTFEPQIVQPVA